MDEIIEKYFWVTDAFSNDGAISKTYELGSAKIESVIVNEYMIHFSIYNPGKPDHQFPVNLMRDDIGMIYRSSNGKITAERFRNEEKNFIYGDWTEEEFSYKWWAICKSS